MSIPYFKTRVSELIASKTPFVFIVDFSMQDPLVFTLKELEKEGYLFNINGKNNTSELTSKALKIKLQIDPFSNEKYREAFEEVQSNINKGNSFLLNLTFPSQIETKASLSEIFHASKAPYKLLKKDDFVIFSPECFIKIKNGHIYSYPMKGTIDARIPNAEARLLGDDKEVREHNTIVDLIRNDLSMISSQVTVTRFRYVEKIKSAQNEILQTSSEIRGKLPEGWEMNFAELLFKLLPAGSVSGAPKHKTLEIIDKVEINERGYYTGVFGLFDGKDIDAGVSIRFIEKENGKLWYRSGGGITALSTFSEEYQELINKIYVPTI